MNKQVQFSPSLMCMNLDKFKDEINFLDKHTTLYHIDIMDGHFVPNITLSPWFIDEVRKISNQEMSAHLMVNDPVFWVDQLINIKCDWICVHVEVLNGLAFRLIDKIHGAGLKVGVVLNPETPISEILPFINIIDKVTIMTVDPGFAGQRFLEGTLQKIVDLRDIRKEENYHFLIEMDGSSSSKTFKMISQADPDIYIVGRSGLFGYTDNIESAWTRMSDSFEKITGKVIKAKGLS